MKSGFIQIRRGLEEHIVNGNVGLFEAGVYLTIHLQANFQSGLWIGSAARLLATAPRGATLRAVQRALNRLSKIKFIRVFHRHGVRGNYRVLIDKYEPFGALKGKRLNAWKSESWQKPFYEPCALSDAVTDADGVGEDAPILEVEGEKQRNKRKPTPSFEQNRKAGNPGAAQRASAGVRGTFAGGNQNGSKHRKPGGGIVPYAGKYANCQPDFVCAD